MEVNTRKKGFHRLVCFDRLFFLTEKLTVKNEKKSTRCKYFHKCESCPAEMNRPAKGAAGRSARCSSVSRFLIPLISVPLFSP